MAGLYEISYDDLEFYEVCDGGNYGCVYRGFWKSKRREVAVKKVLVLDKEAEVLSRLSHRNIVCFYGAVTAEPNVCLVMEYAENGSLYAFLGHRRSNMLPFKHILSWAGQIALGMNYLHNEAPVKVIHRDLKSKNVVISKDSVCKICDFGASRFAGSTTKMTLVGTYAWMAPEVIQSFPVSEACDVWSYGVVLWELLTHEVPFKGIEGFQIAWMVVENGKRLTIPSSCPQAFRSLMESCWTVNPKERPSFHEILKRIEQMETNDELSKLTNNYLQSRKVWMTEIEASLEDLKKLERNLGLREEELHSWENELMEREKNLEKQFHVVQLESYDVNTWREVDVFHWITHQLSDRSNMSDLGQYAEVFLKNNINGRRLLVLTQDDLRKMGIVSQGHIIELHNEIQILKSHNHRLLHFPPLSVSSRPHSISRSPLSRDVKLVATCVMPSHSAPQDTPKWKMLVDVFDVVHPDDDISGLIKHVTFTNSKSTSGHVHKASKYPFYMEKWATGWYQAMVIECTVTFEDHVKRPRSVKIEHAIDVANGRLTEKLVTLVVAQEERTVQASASRHQLVHSQSSPMLLKGAWSTRNLENAVPPIVTNDHQESVWSDVVANRIQGQYPAYRPQYTPIPQVLNRSPSFRSNGSSGSSIQMSGSTSASISFSASSTEPSPQVYPGRRLDWQPGHVTNGHMGAPRASTPVTLNQAEVSFLREQSQDSVFSSPRTDGVVRFTVDDEDEGCETIGRTSQENMAKRNSFPSERKSPLTIASIVNNFIGSDFARRSSTPTLLSANVEDTTRPVRTGSFRNSSGYLSSRGLSEGGLTLDLSNVVEPSGSKATDKHQQKSEEVSRSKSKKRGKRKSMQRQTTMDSVMIYGGNSKWMWKS